MNDNHLREPSSPAPTGNLLVMLDPDTKATTSIKRLENASGMKFAAAADFKSQNADALGQADAVLMDRLNIAVVRQQAGASGSDLRASIARERGVVSMRPEYYMYALDSVRERYESWVRDGLQLLADGAATALRADGIPDPTMDFASDEDISTWGVRAVRADLSRCTGNGIRIVVLDTGFDAEHPDFAGRQIHAESFVPGETPDDVQGHGTHCIGTAAGPGASEVMPRYGVATQAIIHSIKVLNNSGQGEESWIISGINRAIELNCEVISMSLGRRVSLGEPHDPIYEQVGRAALNNGSLIVAAAGNDSRRQSGRISPVSAPANSPSILAVGAIDERGRIADFSNGGLNGDGGEINLCAPGDDILSSVPMPRAHARLRGTSMATPHVAGVAAMFAEADPKLRGSRLWEALRRSARDIGVPIRAGGAGLVQAPSASSGVNMSF